jgi:tRNA(Ile)-lysidine synthase
MSEARKPALLERFIRFIREKKLTGSTDRILVTVSGGVDSVVMAHLFHDAGIDFGIAHCNFKLRGEESDGDEKLVRMLADSFGVPFHVTSFETQSYADNKSLSIQMAARELRYRWFREIAQSENYSLIATAHHRDDLVETVLLNMVKGSVVKGLAGIPEKRGKIIRPMLFAGKDELQNFAKENKIAFREDSSNSSDKYQRNLIRNQVIPLLEKINPSLSETVAESSVARRELADWVSDFVNQNLISALEEENGVFRLSIRTIRKRGLESIHLYEWLSEYGFRFTEIRKLFAGLDSTESLEFNSASHRLVKERENVVLTPISEGEVQTEILIEKGQAFAELGNLRFEFSEIDKPGEIDFSDPNIAWLDADKIQWPLFIRTWQAGDYFYPAGFGKRKKLSDYFTDIKLGKLEKEKQLVMVSGGEIIWVVGKRVDERVKVEEGIREVLRVLMKKVG